jgi:exo-beta-1,3-glucanase (GH17 family)
VVISETGWPSHGAPNGCAVPSLDNQRRFLTELLCQAHQAKINLFYFEAFDESWKAPPEVESHWGVFSANRSPKHSFTPPLRCPSE